MKFAEKALISVTIASLIALGATSPASAAPFKTETECATSTGGKDAVDYPDMTLSEMESFTPCNVNVVPELHDLATRLYEMSRDARLNIQAAQNVRYDDESYDEAREFYQLRAKRIVSEMIVGVAYPSLSDKNGKLLNSRIKNIESIIGQIYDGTLMEYKVSRITESLIWYSAYIYEALDSSKPIYDALDEISVKANGSIKVPLIKGKIATGVPFLKVYVELLEESESFVKFFLAEQIFTKFYITLNEAAQS